MMYKIELVSSNSPPNKTIYALGDSVSTKLSFNTDGTNNITILPFNIRTEKFPNLRPSNLVIPPKSQCKYMNLFIGSLTYSIAISYKS